MHYLDPSFFNAAVREFYRHKSPPLARKFGVAVPKMFRGFTTSRIGLTAVRFFDPATHRNEVWSLNIGEFKRGRRVPHQLV